MSDSNVRLSILASMEQFRDSLRRVVEAAGRLVEHFRRMVPGWDNYQRRLKYGRGQLGHPDGWWQSDLCAAWLHESCQAPDICDCRCRHAERKAAA